MRRQVHSSYRWRECVDRPAYQPMRLPGRREPLDYGLFLAGFPEPADAARLCEAGAKLAREHELRDAVQVPRLAHVTLCGLNHHDPLDQLRHDAAKAAANRLSCPPLPMVFNRARSFAADGAFMLLGDAATNANVARLRRELVAALRRFGLRPEEVAMPHMTMVYNCGRTVDEQPIAPLDWTMRRFALVLSHIGNGHHEYLGEWTLR
jgi:RNA 2',3'-cyclic 3'-phosphodiesterase